jgi:lipopolysaccharide transport system ATP-binding protein
MDAIVIENVIKHFRKSTIQRHHTTLKTEVVRWLRRQERPQRPQMFIESLKGVTLRVPRGKTLGIIGRNGAGKSTLLKIITGIYSPTSGTVEVSGRISALLDLGAGFHPDFSGRENILINGIILGMSRSEIRHRMQGIIDFSELEDFIDEPVRTYSSGMYMRLAFSVATHVDPDILLIDEILAVGDEHFSRKSRAKMNQFKKSGKTIVLVTHDLQTVQSWCDLAAWIDEGRVRSVGDPIQVVRQYKQAVDSGESPPVPHADAEWQASQANGQDKKAFQLRSIHLLDQLGREASTLDSEDGLQIVVEFESSEDLVDLGFSIGITRSDGLPVFATDSFAESVQVPQPLPRSGTLRFNIDRLGLAQGVYSLDIAAQTQAGVDYDSSKGVFSFSVRSATPGDGVVRLPHRWSISNDDRDTSLQRPVAISEGE